MKPVLLITLLFIIVNLVSAQNTFIKTFVTNGVSYGWDVLEMQEGGFLVAGSITPFSTSILVIKTDSYGNLVWQKQIGQLGLARSVVHSDSNNYILAGITNNNIDIYLIKINSDGDTIWTKTISSSKEKYATKIIKTTDGGFALTGWIRNNNLDIYLIRTNKNCDTLWTKTYGDYDTDLGYDIRELPDKGFVIAGTSSGGSEPNFYSYATIIRTDSIGQILWLKKFSVNKSAEGSSVALSSDGGFVLTGNTLSENYISSDIYLLKVDVDGDSVWTKTYGGELSDWASSIQSTIDGGYIITGSTYSYGAGQGDLYLFKSNENENVVWSKTFGGLDSDNGLSVKQTEDSGYIISGVTGNSYDIFLVKTNEDGLVEVKSYDFSPTLFNLYQNYPNPFNPSTKINFVIPKSSFVNLKVYDILGREVVTLVNEEKQPGVYEVEFDASNLSTGVYFYSLNAGDFKSTKKLLLAK